MHQRGDPWVPVDHGRYLAERIAGALLVELDGDAHALRRAQIDPFMREVRTFLEDVASGGWRAPEPDRVDGPARAIRRACAIRDSLRGLDLDIRAALHTGDRGAAELKGVPGEWRL